MHGYVIAQQCSPTCFPCTYRETMAGFWQPAVNFCYSVVYDIAESADHCWKKEQDMFYFDGRHP